MTQPQKRTRLSPEARRNQLLDVAQEMIVSAGLQGFGMEALAREAGVSSPLVYNYFKSRIDLLQALLEREYERYRRGVQQAVSVASSFEEIVHVYVAGNFDHHAPGNILPVLSSQPEIASIIVDAEKRDGRATGQFLVRAAAARFRLDREQAELLVSMASGASTSAAAYCARTGANRDEAIEQVLRFIFSGFESAQVPK